MKPPINPSNPQRQTVLICLALALAVLATYGQLWDCDFVGFDDTTYVTSNDMVKQGLSWPGMVWAFTTLQAGFWHPLTWLSLMADSQFYGINPAGYHFTNLLLHLANSLLLFLLLQRMTKARWPSALAAALFALHPLHVESVAWVSERKDVLSTLFWMLALWAYVRYVEEITIRKMNQGLPGSHEFDSSSVPSVVKSDIFCLLSLVLFALGLMAKPMLVTLPFVMLLLDYWPLRRLRPPLWPLVAEKIPFFALAAASLVVGIMALRRGGAIVSLAAMPFGARLANVPISYARYVGKTFWPADLAVLYPIQLHWPLWKVACAGAFLALITAWAIWRARPQPYLVVGWFWFLGTLVPVIGLVQADSQVMADHYTYIPVIGLFIMVIWGVREWSAFCPAPLLHWLAAVALAACLALTTRQVGYWKNSWQLFAHATAASDDNYLAYYSLGTYYAAAGQRAAAIRYLEQAVRTAPDFASAQNNLGRALFQEGRIDEALDHLTNAVSLNPAVPEFHYNLGNAFLAQGRVAEALDQFDLHVHLTPNDATAQFNFGRVLLDNGLAEDAIPHLQKALQINPNAPDCACALGSAFLQMGRAREAIGQYQKALQLRPDSMSAGANLAWILASNPDPSLRDGARAVALALRADQLAGGQNPIILGTLAAAYAEVGKFSQAAATAQRALQLAGPRTNSPAAAALRAQIALYQSGSPFRDTNAAPPASPPPKH